MTNAIAVIGMACRFPGAADVEAYRRLLEEGREAIRFFTDAELAAAGVPEAERRDPAYVPAAAVLDGIEEFDADFFGIPPREAEIMDPQHRIFLEEAWACLEAAGIDPKRYPAKIGVFASANLSTYLLHHLHGNPRALEFVAPIQILMANNNHFVPTRVSYKLGLRGPSVNVNCACSSSLVAIHVACQSLLNYECDAALAGGVAVQLPQDRGYLYAADGIISPDGHCRPFDAEAEGTVSGNGAGVVLLKRLEDAMADGDRIHAVVRGSAINNDGSEKIGFTAPGVQGQAEAIALALAAAEVDPATVTLIEAHGTGTRVGDPIEIAALTRVFREKTDRIGYCAIGSVKSNFGHLDEAAGVAGFIKTVLALEQRRLYPTLHFRAPNPECSFATSPFFVNAESRAWETNGAPRRAGVSSFGLGGTNAHVVLEEYGDVRKDCAPTPSSSELQILPISARTPSALDALSVRLADTFAAMSANDFEDVAWTLATGRARFPHRRVVVAKTAADAASRLRSREAGHVATRLASMDDAMPPIVFLFSGHGGQYPGMGRGLYATEPVFREALDAISAALAATAGRDLREIILSEEVHRIEWTQPAVFALQIALARLWESRGVRPSAMMGHSAGEYAAACCAGVFSPEDGVRLMAERGRLIRSTRPGAMLAVPLPEKDLIARIGTSTALSLAVVTTPAMGVLSGEPEAIAAFHEAAEADGIECRTVEIDRAAHSSLMDPIVAPFRIVAAGLMLRSPRIPFISNITGAPIAPEEATSPDYWARHLRAPVRFSDGIAALAEKHPRALFIEIGPGRTLAAPVSRHPATAGCLVLSSIRHPEDRIEDAEFFARTLGALWTAGLDLDWEKIHRGSRRRALLPTMPFERKRHWIEPPVRGASLAPAPAPVAERPDLASWIHEPVLVEAPLPATDPSPGRIVIIESEAGTGERLEAAIGSSAIEVMRVAVMEGETPAALLDRLGDALAERIVFLSNGDESETNRSFVFLASLAREILARHDGRPLRFFAVVSDCSESPDRAALRGVLRVLPIEEPAIETRFIEVDFVEDEPAADATARAVAAEILAADRDRPHVVYRDGRRFLPEARRIGRPVLEPMLEDHSRVLSKRQPEDRRSEDHLFSFWRNNGVYLITGGLGSMGLAFAEWIARQARARIVLLDRCGISDGEAGRRARDRIAAIERTGSTVTVEIADVASAAALAGVVARACGQGPLVGVIHTAGIIGGALLVDWTESGAEAVFAPKLGGALALEEALAGRPPEFLVACSSLASRIPVAGQADYAGANAALDAWARRFARRTGAYAVSIAWGFWQELGMIEKAAMPPAEKKRLAEEIARRGWSNAGVEVLDAILRGRLGPEVIVSPEPLAPRLKERPAPAPRPVAHPLLGERLLEGGSVHFRARLSAATHGILDDHRLDGRPVLVGTAYLEMARAAFVEEKGAGPVEIRDVVFLQPLLLASDETREVRTVLVERDGACEFFVVSSKDDSVGAQHAAEEATSCRPAAPLPSWRGAVPQHDRLSPSDSSAAVWRLHARGEARRFDARPDVPSPWRIDDLQPALSSFHTRMAGFGPRWENISQARFSGDATRAAALLALPSSFMDEAADFAIHPALLDNATGFLPIQAAPENVTRLPFSYARVIFHAPASGPIRVEALASGAATNDETAYAARLFDPDGHLLFESEGYLLRRVETDRAESAIENAALELPVRGALDSIRLAPAPRPAPGEGEIEIEVKCSGLNFIETLHALGLLPDPAGMVWRFGLECAGVVARVGAEVRDFKPGDRVMAFANGASQSYMIAPTHCVALIPDRLSFEEAATLPAAYMTAHTALVRKGGLARGESVLIHSAAGGVGLAAVHVARAVGAEVFATAGTEEKRAWLRAQGIATVMDSRSGAFVEESLAATGGRGLDVVLNSLGGEMIDRGLSVLAVNGRFLELGKRDIFAGTPVSLRHFEKMISFIAIDVGPDMAGFDAAWSEVTDRIASGDYPPLPRRTFPASDAAAAFAEMAGGRHIGRLLLDFSDRAAVLASAIVPAVRLQTLEEITGIAPSSDDAEASVTLIEGTEGVVARVWSEVLGRTGIMPDDDFFALQGDSLLGAQVVARLRRRFGVKLPAGALFAERTVRRLAARIDGLLAPAADEEEGTI